MSFQFDTNFKFELVIRLILWTLFLIFDQMEPFIREIQPEELWRYKYPSKPSYVPTSYLWILVFAVPVGLILFDYFKKKDRFETSQALLSLSLTYGLTGVLTTLLKNAVGRPRPDFYNRCFPNGEGNFELNCTGKRNVFMDGRKSFPSGHSSFSFASMVFVSLYLSGKLQLFNCHGRGQTWRLLAVIIPIIIATFIAISRTCDYHHHWEDVCCGAALGTVLSYICYRQYFPKVNSMNSNISYANQGVDVEKGPCK